MHMAALFLGTILRQLAVNYSLVGNPLLRAVTEQCRRVQLCGLGIMNSGQQVS